MRYFVALLVVLFAVTAVAMSPEKAARLRKAKLQEVSGQLANLPATIEAAKRRLKELQDGEAQAKREGDTFKDAALIPRQIDWLKHLDEKLQDLKLKLAYLKGELALQTLEDKIKAAQGAVDAAQAGIDKKLIEVGAAETLAEKKDALQYQKDAVARVRAELKALQDKKVETDKVLAQAQHELATIQKLLTELNAG